MKITNVISFLKDVQKNQGDIEVELGAREQSRKLTGFWVEEKDGEVILIATDGKQSYLGAEHLPPQLTHDESLRSEAIRLAILATPDNLRTARRLLQNAAEYEKFLKTGVAPGMMRR